MKWARTGPRYFFGYNWYAPLDDNLGNEDFTKEIFEKFLILRAEKKGPDAWLEANEEMAESYKRY